MYSTTATHPAPSPASFGPSLALHEGLVQTVVRRQWVGSLSYGELLQAGRIGLWPA